MTTTWYRHTWAEVSLAAIAHNIRLFKAQLSESCRLMAVVKADGYGHGAVEIARTALHAGADYLGVAFVDEALMLRKAEVDAPILILGYTPKTALETAIRNRLTITVASRDIWEEVAAFAARLGLQALVHLKVDTGMSRLGFRPDELLALGLSGSSEWVSIEGIFTHFADADNPDSSFTREQYEAFVTLIERLSDSGIHIPIKHCCNTAATMKYPVMQLDMVRIGIGLYGLSPLRGEPQPSYPLQEAMQLKTTITSIRTVVRNQPVSYGLIYRAEKDCRVATLPIGYADGLSRRLSNRGSVLIREKRVPIIGSVCMDQTMVDVTDLHDLQAGEQVTVFGISGSAQLSIQEIASLMDTIAYEVVCLIGKRVPRVYISDV